MLYLPQIIENIGDEDLYRLEVDAHRISATLARYAVDFGRFAVDVNRLRRNRNGV